VGTYAVQLAHWAGARVLATASGANAEDVRGLGADEVIDYRTTPFETAARDVDLVLDLLGGPTQATSFGVLKKGGRLVSTVQPPSQEEATRHGVRARMFGMKPSAAGLLRLGELIESGDLKVVVSKVYPLAEVRRAWEEAKGGHSRGKVGIEV
jgi:NADPH:quinone reductase-like Zn-dependent oxidoreductase